MPRTSCPAVLLLLLAAPTLTGGALAKDDAPVRIDPGIVSTAENEYNLNATADGTLRVFARSAADFNGSRIMVQHRRDGAWTAPEPIGFTDPRWRDSDPWLTPDGGMLYFVSDRATAAHPDKKDLDLWRSRREPDGSWSAPEHLGDVVNSPGYELGPELHDGVLYFNSSRKGGPGQLDIFMARVETGGFTPPEPLPGPINSPAQEGDFTLSPDGKTAVFWSTRNGKGQLFAAQRTGDGWGDAKPLSEAVNAGDFQFTPQFDATGTTLFYAGTALREGQPAGMADIYAVSIAAAGNW